MSDLSQESPLWREWAESRHSVQQMRDELDRLRAENARLLGDHAAALRLVADVRSAIGEREWRPIETAHKTNRAILVWCRGYKNTYVVTWHNDYNNWVVFGGFGYELSETPTHWMPLPEPPQ